MSSQGQLHLLFVRHGETQDNIERLLQGHRDTSLTEKGLGEAEVLAKDMRAQHKQIDAVYRSPLLRIKQTVEPILRDRSVKDVYVDASLKGQGLGELEVSSHRISRRRRKHRVRFAG